jgi:putative endonuclease
MLDKFYIGASRIEPQIRKDRHLAEYYGTAKFTAKADDWVLFFELECTSFSQALAIEKHIKQMKSKKYTHNLKEFPEMAQKLLLKFQENC